MVWTISRVVAAGVVLGAVVAMLWLLVSVRDVLLLAMLGILFAVLLDACVRLLRAGIGMPRWAALTLVVSFGVAVLVGGGLVLAPSASKDISHLSGRIPQSLEELERRILETRWGDWLSDRLARVEESTSLRDAAQRFLGFFSSALGAASSAVLVLALSLFIAAEPESYVAGTPRLLPPKVRPRGEEVARELGHALRWRLLGRLASAFIERRAVRLVPAVVLSFQVMMGVLAGVLGLILATPILVVLSVLAGMLYLEDGLHQKTTLP